MTNKKHHDLVTLDCILKHETDAAYLVQVEYKQVWIPKSQCELRKGEGTHFLGSQRRMDEIELPEWLAIEKEIV